MILTIYASNVDELKKNAAAPTGKSESADRNIKQDIQHNLNAAKRIIAMRAASRSTQQKIVVNI